MFTCPPRWICGSTILNYFNIHHCEAPSKAPCLCLVSAPCMTISALHNHEPATRPHVCAAQHAPAHFPMQKCKMGDKKTTNIQTTNPLHAFSYPVGTFQWNYLILLLLKPPFHSFNRLSCKYVRVSHLCELPPATPRHHKIWMYLLTCKHLHLVLPLCPWCLPQ